MIRDISNLQELDDFIGKEYWVRVKLKLPIKSSGFYYIRVLSKKSHKEKYPNSEYSHTVTSYTFNSIDIREMNRGDVLVCSQDRKDHILNGPGTTIPDYCIRILQPIEIIPTEEIFSVTG